MQTPASSRPPSLSISTTSDLPATNTLILPNLPPAFFTPRLLEPLRQHFASYGELYAWTPLKGFKRILVVYWDAEDAEVARESDGLVVGHERLGGAAPVPSESPSEEAIETFTLRVYRGDPTPLQTAPSTLRPPEIPHNYLISPPGSPPVGWEQVREEPPNTATLAEDLVRALEGLRMERERLGREHEPHVLVHGDGEEQEMSPSGSGLGTDLGARARRAKMPRVVVQDADAEAAVRRDRELADGWAAPLPRLESVRTARPPMAGE